MDKNMLINNLLANYGKYGVTRAALESIIDDGIQNCFSKINRYDEVIIT